MVESRQGLPRPPGNDHTTKKAARWRTQQTDNKSNAEISALRAPVERLVAHFKSWRILHTDYRRPYATYQEAYDDTRIVLLLNHLEF